MNESENCRFSFTNKKLFYLLAVFLFFQFATFSLLDNLLYFPCANARGCEILGFLSYQIVISSKKNYFRPQDIFSKITMLYQLFIAKCISIFHTFNASLSCFVGWSWYSFFKFIWNIRTKKIMKCIRILKYHEQYGDLPFPFEEIT